MAHDEPPRFLFVSAPLSGHLDWGGYLKTAAYLSRAGHPVLWVSEEPIREAVEAAGVSFRAVDTIGWRWPSAPAPDQKDLPERSSIRFQRALLLTLSEDAIAHATQALLEIAREFKPDVIVGEPTIGAAAMAAEKLDLPYAVCGYPAVRRDRDTLAEAERAVAEEAASRLERLFQRLGVGGRNWPADLSPWPESPNLHVVYWSRAWYADELEVLPQTVFVGGQASAPQGDAPTWFDQLSQHSRLAFVTLGSLFTDDPQFFVTAAHACVHAGVFPIIGMGRSPRAPHLKQELAPRLPRCIAVSWVDYDHLFPRLAAVVHHGGMGTTHAAVLHGVPQIIVPHAADQVLQAARAEAAGVGLTLRPGEATLESVQAAVETIVRDPGFGLRAKNLKEAFAAGGGVALAAERVAALASLSS